VRFAERKGRKKVRRRIRVSGTGTVRAAGVPGGSR